MLLFSSSNFLYEVVHPMLVHKRRSSSLKPLLPKVYYIRRICSILRVVITVRAHDTVKAKLQNYPRFVLYLPYMSVSPI